MDLTQLPFIYIAYRYRCVKHGKILLYADDLKLFKRIDDITSSFQLYLDLYSLIEWSKNNLKYTVKKYSIMTYSRKPEAYIMIIHLEGEPLLKESCIKYLVVLFDAKRIFKEHILSVCKSAFSLMEIGKFPY